MCGSSSAIGLSQAERDDWPQLRERLRQPGRLMALVRGVLGGDEEVAAVAAVSPNGILQPLAILVTTVIDGELELSEPSNGNRCAGRIGDYDVDVLLDDSDVGSDPRPIAILMTPWIYENLILFSRELWTRR